MTFTFVRFLVKLITNILCGRKNKRFCDCFFHYFLYSVQFFPPGNRSWISIYCVPGGPRPDAHCPTLVDHVLHDVDSIGARQSGKKKVVMETHYWKWNKEKNKYYPLINCVDRINEHPMDHGERFRHVTGVGQDPHGHVERNLRWSCP